MSTTALPKRNFDLIQQHPNGLRQPSIAKFGSSKESIDNPSHHWPFGTKSNWILTDQWHKYGDGRLDWRVAH